MPRTLFVLNRLDVVQATVRALQFKDYLKEATFELRVPPWLQAFESWWPKRRLLRWPADCIVRAVSAHRERRLERMTTNFDLVYNVGVPSFDFHQRLVEARNRHGFKLITDMVDAQWLPWFAQFGWDHLNQMLAESDAAFVTNRFLAEYAKKHCAHVAIIPDAPQLEAFDRQRKSITRPKHEVRVGWIGGRDTVYSLHKIHEVLEQVARERPHLHLRIVGAPVDRLPRFENVRWSSVEHYDQDAMVTEALQMHIGLFPQFHVEESLCRGSLKAKIYMAGEVAVIAERLGENEELIADGRNGLLANSTDQWRRQLIELIDNRDRCAKIAAAGLNCIRETFSATRIASLLDKSLQAVASASPPTAVGNGVADEHA